MAKITTRTREIAASNHLLLPPDLRDWLPEDHFAWLVIEVVDELDLEPFYCASSG
jgi:hypothetical protein